MDVESSELKRCCYCNPSLHGLLTSGYIKLVVSLLMLIAYIDELRETNTYPELAYISPAPNVPFVLCGILILLMLADTTLTIVLLIGGHKKDAKLLKICNYCSMGSFVLFALVFVLNYGLLMYSYIQIFGFEFFFFSLKSIVINDSVNLASQVYMIFLTKSEIAKLENHCKFGFVYNAYEDQCKMDGEGGNNIGTSVQNNKTVNGYEIVEEN